MSVLPEILCGGWNEKCAEIAANAAAISDLSSRADSDNQTLTPTVTDGETTAINISNGNTIQILHNHPDATIPDQDVCTNLRLPYTSNPTSWWTGWTAVITDNQAQEVVRPYTTIAQRTNTTGKTVDMSIDLNWGNHLIYSRRNRVYLWLDYRVLVNGTAVVTRANQVYWYTDNRNDTNPDVVQPQQYEMQHLGESLYHRYNIPAGAVVEVQTQSRWQVAASQTSAYARYIGGLRSQASIDWHLQNIVVGRL